MLTKSTSWPRIDWWPIDRVAAQATRNLQPPSLNSHFVSRFVRFSFSESFFILHVFCLMCNNIVSLLLSLCTFSHSCLLSFLSVFLFIFLYNIISLFFSISLFLSVPFFLSHVGPTLVRKKWTRTVCGGNSREWKTSLKKMTFRWYRHRCWFNADTNTVLNQYRYKYDENGFF